MNATFWAVGANVPGYLPEGDVYVTEDWESARSAMLNDLDRAADSYASAIDTVSDAIAEQYGEAMRELSELAGPSEWYAVLPTSDSPHDLGVAYWIDVTDEAPTDDE